MALVFLLSAWILAKPDTPIGVAELDFTGRIPAQDESLYAHGVLRMAAGGEWATPKFLGRNLLVKPPLLQWLSALSLKVFGWHVWALRLPSLLAAAALACLVYLYAGPVGWLLLLSRAQWRAGAGLLMMDDLLTMFYLGAVLVLSRDRKLEAKWSPWAFGALVGLAVMTKWFAGFLPLALLLWARPDWRKLIAVFTALFAVGAPWHIYQLLVNREWFLAEYFGVELLGYALNAPVQSSAESHWHFYFVRGLDCLVCAIPLLRASWNREWILWSLTLAAGIAAYSYQNATYLIPLVPALLLAHRGWIHWAFLPLAFIGAVMPHGDARAPAAIDEQLRGREVLHLDPDDQLRTSLAPGATVRYVFMAANLPPNGALDFEKLGIAVRARPFLAHPDSKVDAVLVADIDELRTLVRGSPQRDFIVSREAWKAMGMEAPHEALNRAAKVWLKSRSPQLGPRPNQFPLLDGPGFAK